MGRSCFVNVFVSCSPRRKGRKRPRGDGGSSKGGDSSDDSAGTVYVVFGFVLLLCSCCLVLTMYCGTNFVLRRVTTVTGRLAHGRACRRTYCISRASAWTWIQQRHDSVPRLLRYLPTPCFPLCCGLWLTYVCLRLVLICSARKTFLCRGLCVVRACT